MSKEITETGEFVIKIPKHIWQGTDELQASNEQKTDFDILERTGVSIKRVERESVYGKTEVQTFTLEEKEYREKILDLLNNPALYAYSSKILHYIYVMGGDPDNEKRFFAAKAASILSNYLPFADLENTIFSKWANELSFRFNQSAARALARMLQNDQHRNEVSNLIKHWSSKSHIGLVNSILLVYEVVHIDPNETLGTIKNILSNGKTLSPYSSAEFLVLSDAGESSTKLSWETIRSKIFSLIRELYLTHSLTTIKTLHDWFQDRADPNLPFFSAIRFLSLIDIKDVAKDDAKRAKTVAYLYDLWEDKKAPKHAQLQQLTTDSIYNWAKTALKENLEESERILCQQFFHELHQKCASTKQNRLDFHLRRWHNQFQQSGKVSASSTQPLNFLSLIPDSKQA